MKAPFPPNACFRDFLPPSQHRALLDWALAAEPLFRPSQIMTGGGKIVDEARRKTLSVTAPDAALPWKAAFVERLVAALPEIFARVGMKPFPVSEIQLDLAASGAGGHIAAHRDTSAVADPAGDKMLSAVYYFFREPKSFSGGMLRLHRLGGGEAAGDHLDIEPEQNMLAAFPSFVSHELTPVRCPSGRFPDFRFAINCWFLRKRD